MRREKTRLRDPSLGNLKKEEEARFSPEVSYIALKYLPLVLNCQTFGGNRLCGLNYAVFFSGVVFGIFFLDRFECRIKIFDVMVKALDIRCILTMCSHAAT